MRKALLTLAVMMVGTVIATSVGLGAVPQLVNYQGRLTDSAGGPLNTTVSITFTFYDSDVGGNSKWTETHNSVVVTEGLFNVLLGSVEQLVDTVFNDSSRYLEIIVEDSILSPRTRITSTPYAFHSQTSDVALSVASSQSAWFIGGDLSDLHSGGGQLTTYPHEEYEYGFKLIDQMIQRAVCSKWNVGLRFYNIEPSFIDSDNPSSGMRRGGSMFFIDTNSPDDDAATPSAWHHAYWFIDHTDTTLSIKIFGGFGNVSSSVYCRMR